MRLNLFLLFDPFRAHKDMIFLFRKLKPLVLFSSSCARFFYDRFAFLEYETSYSVVKPGIVLLVLLLLLSFLFWSSTMNRCR